MAKALVYRHTTLADLEQVKHLGLISYGQFTDVLGVENWEQMKSIIDNNDNWHHILTNSTGFVCCYEEKIVGMAFIFPSGKGWHFFKPEWSYIRMVGVNPIYGGKGIAKTLTQKCIDYAKQTNEKIIALHTSEFMHAARHIYESAGFKVKEQLEGRYGKKYWLYMMEV